MHSDFPPNLSSAVEFLEKFNPAPEDEVIPRELLRLQRESTEELAMDLILSSHVFAVEPVTIRRAPGKAEPSQTATDTSGLAEATQALSLNAEGPPPVEFHALVPFRQVDSDEEEELPARGGGASLPVAA